MTKKEFNVRTSTILKHLQQTAERYKSSASDEIYHKELAGIAEHDPALAEMCRDLETSYLASLDRIIRHISTRVEN